MEESEGEAHALLLIRDGEASVVPNPDDDDLAEAVQMQELLFFQFQQPPQGSATPNMASHAPITHPIDPKGKQPLEFSLHYATTEPAECSTVIHTTTQHAEHSTVVRSITEHGECSQLIHATTEPGDYSTVIRSTAEHGECSEVVHDTFNCPICMELLPADEGFNINTCDHIFCISCMIHYIAVKTEDNVVVIPCPTPGCKTKSVDPETCQHILPSDTFDRWSLALCELSLGLNKFYCPFKDCSALLINEGGEDIINCECPHCNRMFCARCKVPWHGDMSCDEFEKLGEDERGREDLLLKNLVKDKRWQRCPKCRMYVEKTDGCMFMRCRCRYCFCYVCASPMSDATHYCEKCKR